MELLEPKYAEGLLKSVHEVFETMIFMTPTGTAEVDDDSFCNIHDEVIGVLGFTGTRTGLVAIRCNKPLALQVCAGMLGMEPEEIEGDADVADSFGELANMIGGSFKNLWVEDGNTMDLAIPSVVFGQGTTLCTSADGISYGARLEFDQGSLTVHLRMES